MQHDWWRIDALPATTEKNYQRLRDAVLKKDITAAVRILKRPGAARSFIVRRGEGNVYVSTLLDAYHVILKQTTVTGLVSFLHEQGLSEYLLWEWMAAAYRLRQRRVVKNIAELVTVGKSQLMDYTAQGLVLHELAAWAIEIDHDAIRGAALHRAALGCIRKGHDGLAAVRIKFGVSIAKMRRTVRPLSPQQRVKDFSLYAKQYRRVGDEADALRGDSEVAVAWYDVAMMRKPFNAQPLIASEKIAKQVLSSAKKLGYPNAVIVAKEILGNCAYARGNDTQGKKLHHEALTLRHRFDYPTTSYIQPRR